MQSNRQELILVSRLFGEVPIKGWFLLCLFRALLLWGQDLVTLPMCQWDFPKVSEFLKIPWWWCWRSDTFSGCRHLNHLQPMTWQHSSEGHITIFANPMTYHGLLKIRNPFCAHSSFVIFVSYSELIPSLLRPVDTLCRPVTGIRGILDSNLVTHIFL